jgi:hypothetical protein
MAALALGGTRQGEPRRDKQSGQGRPSTKSQGQHQGVLGGRSTGANNAIVRAKLPLRTPALPLQASAEEAVELASPRQASHSRCPPSGCIRAPTATYLRCEAKVHALMPCRGRRSPKREASAACSSCEMLLASWQTCHGTEARRNWSTRRSAWQASKKKILGNLTLQHPDDDGFYDEQRGIRLRFRRLFTSMPLSDVAFVPLCCYVRDWAHRGTMGLVLVLLGRTEAGRRTNWRRSLPGDQFAKSAVSPDCLEF